MSETTTLKPFTNYICSVGAGMGHKAHWTGAYLKPHPTDGQCICGAPMIEEASTRDGHRYRLEWESIDSHVADQLEQQHGRGVWGTLSDEQWQQLDWHPVAREADIPGEIKEQFGVLSEWAETHEQPIRNVRLLRSDAGSWDRVAPQDTGGEK